MTTHLKTISSSENKISLHQKVLDSAFVLLVEDGAFLEEAINVGMNLDGV